MQRLREKKRAYLKTEEGKEYNRQKSKNYYEAHREEVLAKRPYDPEKCKLYYEKNRDKILIKAKEIRERKKGQLPEPPAA